MKRGYLSQYFRGVAFKKLSAVEVDTVISNQHEFNGVSQLKKIFGAERKTLSARFIYLNDNDFDPVTDCGFLTWYDARENHPTRTEYRMYFPTTTVSQCASAGDELFIGLLPDDTVLVIIAEGNSTICSQLRWLFGLSNTVHPGFSVREELESEQDRIAFASRFILEEIGITVQEDENPYLDDMLHRFHGEFPPTQQFSAYARSTLPYISSCDDPDETLLAWMEREEILYRTLEKHIIGERLSRGFGDVDNFFKFSLSAQNRRKARAGKALENHVEQLLIDHKIRYDRNKITENNSKPDFIFPGIVEYHDCSYDASLLTMLGVKSTCKDRWRQVLTEAGRIKEKHLLTLEAAISENQTEEMKFNKLHLVVPRSLFPTFSLKQQNWLIDVSTFFGLVKYRQSRV